MKNFRNLSAVLMAVALLSACKGTKRIEHYGEIYGQKPQTVLIVPVSDLSMRKAVREEADSLYNVSLNKASIQLYLTASDPLVNNGYYVLGPLASSQLMATDKRTGKQLRNESVNDFAGELGVDALLFIDIHEWSHTSNSWTVKVEYVMRSTHTNSEILHVHVNATKVLPTDFKGNPKPLSDDIDFANRYGCDLETAQRCRLVELLNQYVLKDLPPGNLVRSHTSERYLKPHPEYFNLRIRKDGSVEQLKDEEL